MSTSAYTLQAFEIKPIKDVSFICPLKLVQGQENGAK